MRAGRHQQDRDVGESGRVPLFAPEIPPVHDRHQEVEQDQVAAPLAVSELPQGLGTVRRAERVVAGILQNGRDRIEGVGIVLDDQHDPAGAGGPGERSPVRETRRFDVRHRLQSSGPAIGDKKINHFRNEDRKSGIPLDIAQRGPILSRTC